MDKKRRIKIWIYMTIFVVISLVSLFLIIPNFDSPFLSLLFWFIGIVLVISFTTLIHEFGHYLVATKNGVKVYEFAIGFGPTLFSSVRDNGTLFSIKLLPLGGYVSVASDLTNEKIKEIKNNFPNMTEEERQKFIDQLHKMNLDINNFENDKSIDSISYPRKTLFAAGGILFNLASIFILSFMGNFLYGTNTPTNGIIIPSSESVYEVHSAYSYDLETKEYGTEISGYQNIISLMSSSHYNEISDLVTFTSNMPLNINLYYSLNGTKYEITDSGILNYKFYSLNGFKRGEEVLNGSSSYQNENIAYLISFEYYNLLNRKADSVIFTNGTYNENGVLQDANFKIEFLSDYSTHLVLEGYSNSVLQLNRQQVKPIYFKESAESIKYSGFELIYVSLIDSFKVIFYSLVLTIDFFLLGVISQNTNFHMVSSGLEQYTFASYFQWFVNVSIILSALMIFFNILPIPPLDGWKITQYTYEGKTKKKIRKETEKKVSMIGWLLIIAIMFLLLFF